LTYPRPSVNARAVERQQARLAAIPRNPYPPSTAVVRQVVPGAAYGWLTVIARQGERVRVRCTCGVVSFPLTTAVIDGRVRSCGLIATPTTYPPTSDLTAHGWH